MALRKADHPACALQALHPHERIGVDRRGWRVGEDGGKVIVENEGAVVNGVAMTPHPFVAGAEIAARIVCWSGIRPVFFRPDPARGVWYGAAKPAPIRP